MTNSIILLVLFFVLVALVMFIVGKVTRGIIRLILLAVIVAISIAAARIGFDRFATYIPGLASRPSPTVIVQPTPVPSASSASPSTPQATPSQPQAQTGETGLAQIPQFVQTFDAPAIKTASRQANNSTNGAGNRNSNGTGNRSQARSQGNPIPAGW
ncbi:MAG TPA: hypothetical protein V6C78_28805 [Crinalium sp.]